MARKLVSDIRNVPIVTSLPASPNDGMEVYYKFTQNVIPADASVVIWHLVYDLATTAWYPVGQQEPVYAVRGTFENILDSLAAYTWFVMNANDPRATVPLAGDYEVEWGVGRAWANPTGNNVHIGISLSGIGLAATAAANDTGLTIAMPGTSSFSASGPGSYKWVGAVTGNTAQMQYQISATQVTMYRGAAYVKLFPRKITGN